MRVTWLGLVHDPERSDMRFVRGFPPGMPPRQRALDVRGLPLVKPPWGRITAIDLAAGDFLWQIAHGETPDHVRGHRALRGVDVPITGRIGRVGTLVTKTLGTDVAPARPCARPRVDRRRGRPWRRSDRLSVRAA